MEAPLSIDTPGESLDVYLNCSGVVRTRISATEIRLNLTNVSGEIVLVVDREFLSNMGCKREKLGLTMENNVLIYVMVQNSTPR